MLFDFLKDITQTKKGDLLNLPENYLQFNPYLLQRFLSMQSPITCEIVNQVTNKKISLLDKKQIYQLFLMVVPKQWKTTFNYLKKPKDEFILSDRENLGVEIVAKRYKISKKDVIEYMKELGFSVEKYIRGLD